MADEEDVPRGRGRMARQTLRRLLHHRLFLMGLVLTLFVFAIALLAPLLTDADPNRLRMRDKFLPPGWDHLFGTDNFGRSLYARVIWGARLSVEIGISVVAINAVFGTLVGAIAGYFRAADNMLMRVNDALMAFPAILLAIGVTAVFGPSVGDVILALSIVYIPRTARIVRASVIVLREMEYVQAAIAAGAGHWRILRHHIVPNAMAPLIVQLELPLRLCRALGGDAQLPRPGRGAADADLGEHHGGGPAIHGGCALDHLDSRRGAHGHRARPQPAGRRTARRARSASAHPAMSLLEVADLTTAFRTERGEVAAIEEVSFSLDAGEVLGIVGESGSGKSVTALTIMGLLPQPPARIAAGSIRFEGQELTRFSDTRMQRIRGPGIAMVFQEPMTSLNPIFTIGEQIMETVRAHERIGARAQRDRAVEMLEKVGIPSAASRLGSYPHQLSGGQRQRVMIAMALACRPRLLIADEPTTALDVTIQAQILDLLLDLRDEFGMAVLIITHNMGVIAETADRVMVMYAGRVIEEAPVARLFAQPSHPYTRGLLECVPSLGVERERLAAIAGTLPEPGRRPDGCRFAPRCRHCIPACTAAPPPLLPIEAGHAAACIRAHELDLVAAG